MQTQNYIKDVLGMDPKDVREIKTTFFNCFKEVTLLREFNKMEGF